MIGINLSGAEFGRALPGVHGVDYIYPTANLKTYAAAGIDMVRLPFRWERMQPTLNGSIDQTELGRMKTFLAEAAAQGIDVIVDAHNYGRYRDTPIGTGSVTPEAFADFWKKLATELQGQTAVIGYDLMNEPHNMGGADRWPRAAQMATDAIRTVDMTRDIYVEGDGWSGANSWKTINGNLNIIDPANKIIYEAHQYFDDNGSGTYDETYEGEAAHANIGVNRLKPFTDWLKETGNKGFVGEFAVPDNDPRWLPVLDNFMAAMKTAGISGTYWGAGSWWGNYPLALIGADGLPNPQLAVVQKHAADLAGQIIVTPPPPVTIEGTANADTLSGSALDNIMHGHGGNDNLKGLGGNDTLYGEAGNDTLDGSIGTDVMIGGIGNDTYVIDTALDVVTERAGEGSDRVNSTVSYTLATNVEDLVLYGAGNITATGNGLGNRIIGNSGANTISGMTGNDVLRGAGGIDILEGGAGSDRFDFDVLGDSSGSAVDRIIDFTRNVDKIDLSSLDANTGLTGNQAFTFVGSGAFTGIAGQVHYVVHDEIDPAADHLLVQADVNGDRVADFTVRVDGLQPLQTVDLIL